MMIQNYSDFCEALVQSGFSLGNGSNDEGIFSLLNQGDNDPLTWHSGNPETDPWEWRMRVLQERNDIAYGKVFFRKSGYITKAWYPYFLTARRNGRGFDAAYADGLYSHPAKRIFEALSEHGALSVHRLKLIAGFGKEDKSHFDKALTDLQMGLFITACGRANKRNQFGEEYGWASSTFCTVHRFWPDLLGRAAAISPNEAEQAIAERVHQLNPNADGKKLKKFIYGR